MNRIAYPVCLALVLFAPAAAAEGLPDGMTMHRKAAGTLDAAGWTTAISTGGAFSVRLPIKFNDFTMAMPASETKVSRLYVVGGKTAQGLKFSVQRIAYRRPDLARDYFSRIESGETFRAKGGVVKPLLFGTHRAVDVALENNRSVGHLRYVLLKDSLIFLIVEVPRKHRDKVSKQMVQTFLTSLRVTPL